MKLVAIAVVLLLLLGGGGGAYWYFYMRADPDAADMAEEEPPPEPAFVEFNPIQIPLINGDVIEEQFAISVTLEAGSPENGDLVVMYSPRLNDAFLQVLYGVVRKDQLKSGTLDIQMVKAKILRVCNKILGEGVVQDVLIQAIGQQQRTFSGQ